MGGPCYFPYVFDYGKNKDRWRPGANDNDNNPFNKSKKCDCKEYKSHSQALV